MTFALAAIAGGLFIAALCYLAVKDQLPKKWDE